MLIILKNKVRNIIKDVFRLIAVIILLTSIVCILVSIKYKKIYKVTINGEDVGYIENVENFKNDIENDMYSEEEKEFMAFYTIEKEPKYIPVLVDKETETNESKIINKVKENSTITYLAYSIILDGKKKAYVSTIEEAEEILEEMKKEIDDEDLKMTLEVSKEYTEDLSSLEISNKETIEDEINEDIKNAIKIKSSTVNGIVLATTPVKGTYISSRYGDTEGRGNGHCGLDIAAPKGTKILACGDGTVKLASESYYGYGKLVIIDHGNGVQTYYGHCSKLCVTTGQKVKAGDKIAEVGATGQATGPHLHLEVRINGKTVNPQKYVYK